MLFAPSEVFWSSQGCSALTFPRGPSIATVNNRPRNAKARSVPLGDFRWNALGIRTRPRAHGRIFRSMCAHRPAVRQLHPSQRRFRDADMSEFLGGFVPGEGEAMRSAKRRIGRMLCNRWHVDSLLGMGGMASVYAATHRNGKRVALK